MGPMGCFYRWARNAADEFYDWSAACSKSTRSLAAEMVISEINERVAPPSF